MSKQIIHHQVDLMLFEDGRFSVITWLLRECYLDYSDYERWGNGETDFLEDHFKATIPAIMTDLEIAQRYAKKLKLESFPLSYSSVNNKRLHICRLPANELMFATEYEPAQDRLQMDLFFDSAPACTANDLIRALIDEREDDVFRSISQLQALAPEKQQNFARLLAIRSELTVSRKTSAIFGEVLIDQFPDGQQVLGGAPFNVAWHLQAFGQHPCFISRVGKDATGATIRKAMADWGMNIENLQIDHNYPTGTDKVTIDKDEPSYEILAGQAYDFIAAQQLNPAS